MILTTAARAADGRDDATAGRTHATADASAAIHRFWTGAHRGVEDIDDGEENISFPDIHDPPLAQFGHPPERHDPFLFPWLVNLVAREPGFMDDSPDEDRRQRVDKRRRFDIRFPGADLANFPNSACTLPKGRMYIETAPFTLTGPGGGVDGPTYNWEFLLRYGLTDNLEFRIFSNGLTATGEPESINGFSPLVFDFKVHFWGENPKYLLPAAGLEVYLQTTFGSPSLNHGTHPSVTLLFDKTLPHGWVAGVNLGITGNQTPVIDRDRRFDEVIYEVAVEWSLQRQLFENFDVFYHGFVNSASLPRLVSVPRSTLGTAVVQGIGGVYVFNDRISTFGSYNLGAGESAPEYFTQFGFAVAF